MFASFHSNGTTPSFNDKLNTLASGILICSTVSISNIGWLVLRNSDQTVTHGMRSTFHMGYLIADTSEN